MVPNEMVKFYCACGQKIGVSADKVGRKVVCPSCQQPVIVEAAPIALPPDNPPPSVSTPPIPTARPPIIPAGMMACTACNELTKKPGYSVLLIIGVIVTFPIGLLLLLFPSVGQCAKCGSEVRAPGMRFA